jgi:hypothetical protein
MRQSPGIVGNRPVSPVKYLGCYMNDAYMEEMFKRHCEEIKESIRAVAVYRAAHPDHE